MMIRIIILFFGGELLRIIEVLLEFDKIPLRKWFV